MKRVLILGGAGAIGSRTIGAALACSAAHEIVVADLSLDAAAKAAAHHPGRAVPLQLDVFDETALRAAMRGVDAVLNCAGPFYRTSLPCLKAAIAEKRIYLDVCDGWDTTREALALDGAAREAGIPAVIGLGASPGITNLLARIAAAELDRCDEIVTGVNLDPGAPVGGVGAPGRAVHWLRQLGGEVEVWRGGKRAPVDALQILRLDLPGTGARALHLIGHPEPLTLPRTLGGLADASHVLALDRAEAALAEGLSERVAAGKLTPDRAAQMVAEPGRRPLDLRLRVLAAGLGRRRTDTPPLFAYAAGMRHGRRRRVAAWITRLPQGGAAGAAAAALAVGMELALLHRMNRNGVSAPEDIVDPHVFFEEFAAAATPRGTAPSPLIQIASDEEVTA
ncbi:MAG: saccharopine dehydrogenase NADP-binding domain-containing protein [Alphaproteobacteria bacterium]